MDGWLVVALYAAAGIGGVCLLICLIRSGNPVRRLLGSVLQGACALAAVNVTGMFTGVSVGLNAFSAVCCTALGVPGVIGMLLLNVIFAL